MKNRNKPLTIENKAIDQPVEGVVKRRWKKSAQTVGKFLKPVESFCAPAESVETAVKAIGKSVSYPLFFARLTQKPLCSFT